MNRRHFIRTLATALPAGAIATQIKAETDPIRAAYLAIKAALDETAPEGYEVLDQIFIVKGRVIANAFPPNYTGAEPSWLYRSDIGWTLSVAA